ncbi:hypothetical protein PR202_ga25476 [Eleusine coracana subsp. coracana]|uniref:Uncharacterized protein n=1 Tax=Eleusine coracana subsp. coracana TaxID=191504 RepID=A0AAV5DC17_ELECO|nr:hypothetical protein PR202_ga25416 [Eleusine coracana subsp. coracana]GJN07632.1 hypothetical protein PR202_ga25476 [Eleusine coracana subsp. coracana]
MEDLVLETSTNRTNACSKSFLFVFTVKENTPWLAWVRANYGWNGRLILVMKFWTLLPYGRIYTPHYPPFMKPPK